MVRSRQRLLAGKQMEVGFEQWTNPPLHSKNKSSNTACSVRLHTQSRNTSITLLEKEPTNETQRPGNPSHPSLSCRPRRSHDVSLTRPPQSFHTGVPVGGGVRARAG